MVALAIPLLNQLNPVPYDPNAGDDCGPESISMCARYLGIIEPELQIKGEETGNVDFIGYTDVTQMATWFMKKGIPSTAIQVNDVPGYIVSSLNAGFPCIYLRWSDLVSQTGGHFTVPVSYDPAVNTFGINNPLGGVKDWWTADQMQQNSKYGWVVQVERVELTMDELYNQQWRSRKVDVAINPNAAIYKDWISHRQKKDTTLGVPVTEEFPYVGGFAQLFTGGIGVWTPGGGVQWL